MVTDRSPPAAAAGGGLSSPQSRQRSLHSPWASVVRGDSEQSSSPTATTAAAPSGFSSPPAAEEASASGNSTGSENNGDSNAGGRRRRPAWNRQLNGVVEPVSVMGGALSWPALSEAIRPVTRSLSDPPSGSAPSSQAPIVSQSSPQSSNSNVNSNHSNSAVNNQNPARQRSRNRGGGGGGSHSSGGRPSHTTFNPLPMPPPFPFPEVPYMIPTIIDNPVRNPRPIGGGGVGVSQSDHSPRGNSRRGNYGARPRGDGQYNRRDVHPSPYVSPPVGYNMPPPLPPGAAPFMGVFPGFDMAPPLFYAPPIPPPGSFRTMPIGPPLPPPVVLASENSLTYMIVNQIDFYFSDDNLVKDSFLRSKMDDHGWVPISLIASFRRVEQLTKDIPLILECLRYSFIVEVEGDKVRRRNEWNKWLLPSSSHSGLANGGDNYEEARNPVQGER